MTKLKYYLMGCVFLVIALFSLYVMLSWKHPTTTAHLSESESISTTKSTPLGFPFIWASDVETNSITFSADPYKTSTEKQINSPKLIADIIVWGVGLGLVALAIHGIDRVFIK